MDETLSDWMVGIAVAGLGLIGVVLAAHALDNEMSVFGYGLFAFAVAFDLNLMRRRFDEADARRVTASPHGAVPNA